MENIKEDIMENIKEDIMEKRVNSIKSGTHVVKRGNTYIPPGRKIRSVIVVLKRINVAETIKTFEVKKFEKTLLPGEIELVIESNDTAVRKLEDLRQLIKKVNELGFKAEAKIYESEWISCSVEIGVEVCYDKIVIEIKVPKKGEWSKLKDSLKNKTVEELLTTLERLAIEEKTKASMFLKQLEDMKLVIYVETRETDC